MIKKIKLLALTAVMLMSSMTFTSCSKDDNKTENNISFLREDEPIDLDKIKSVLALNGESQIIAYRMLNANEKFYLWNEKLQKIINEDNFNTSQRNFIVQIKNSLEVKYFYNTIDDDGHYYYNTYLREMKLIGSTLFTKSEMVSCFSQISSRLLGGNEVGGDGGGAIHCRCATSDDWCITGNCYSLYCNSADGGCGWWLQQTCNGFCATT